MMTVVPIVEGDGEVAALPVLLRRIDDWLSPAIPVEVAYPIRVRRDQFLQRRDVFEKQLRLAALKCTQPGWILILLDADDDCPKALAEDIVLRARAIAPDRRISVVLANHEYEAWFLAAADSLSGKRGFTRPPGALPQAETVRGAKEWLSRHIPAGKYREVSDQPAFSAMMDLQQAHDNSRSFRKLCSDWNSHMAVAAP
jgi:hypothetical protein